MLRLFLAGALLGMPLAATAAEGTAPQGTVPQVTAPLSTAVGPSLTPPNGTLVAAGPAPVANLLYTGDVIGYVDPCG